MPSRRDRELALEAELRGLQLVVATILGYALTYEKDKEKSVTIIKDSVAMATATASLEKIPQAKREGFRQAMLVAAENVLDMATHLKAAQKTTGQH